MASVAWLLGQLGYPDPHVQAVIAHLDAGGSAADAPCLASEDRSAVSDLVARRTGERPQP